MQRLDMGADPARRLAVIAQYADDDIAHGLSAAQHAFGRIVVGGQRPALLVDHAPAPVIQQHAARCQSGLTEYAFGRLVADQNPPAAIHQHQPLGQRRDHGPVARLIDGQRALGPLQPLVMAPDRDQRRAGGRDRTQTFPHQQFVAIMPGDQSQQADLPAGMHQRHMDQAPRAGDAGLAAGTVRRRPRVFSTVQQQLTQAGRQHGAVTATGQAIGSVAAGRQRAGRPAFADVGDQPAFAAGQLDQMGNQISEHALLAVGMQQPRQRAGHPVQQCMAVVAGRRVAFGDILLHAEQVTTVPELRRHHAEVVPEHRAVGADILQYAPERTSVGQAVAQARAGDGVVIAILQEAAVAPQHLVTAVAGQPFECRIAVDDGMAGMVGIDDHGTVLDTVERLGQKARRPRFLPG